MWDCGGSLKNNGDKKKKSKQRNINLTEYIMEPYNNYYLNVTDSDHFVIPPLHLAALKGKKNKVRRLLAEGADVNSRDGDGETPLHYAACTTRLSIIKILVEHGAIIDAPNDSGAIPLMVPVSYSPRTVRLLIKLGGNVNYTDPNGWSPLMWAVSRLKKRHISVLLEEGADVNITAAVNGKPVSLLSLLLNKWYAEKKVKGIALELLKRGAPVKYVRNDAIHRLVALGSVELVHKLILRGLHPTDIVLKGEIFDCPLLTFSPLTLCLALNRLELATYFIDNWFLTRTDVKVLSRNTAIKNYLSRNVYSSETWQLVMKISSRPLKLVLLSFIAVSTAVGLGPDRAERVEKIGLPHDLRDRLMYRNVYRNGKITPPVRASKKHKASESIYRELTKQQIFETGPDDYYYQTQNTFFEEIDLEDLYEQVELNDEAEVDAIDRRAEEVYINESDDEEEVDIDEIDLEEELNINDLD
ncbi:hypothetical protein Btru_052869 [Bulinus truncatus]|nr:hypothetical protein Btru_052869 [Bulinus truncatus]